MLYAAYIKQCTDVYKFSSTPHEWTLNTHRLQKPIIRLNKQGLKLSIATYRMNLGHPVAVWFSFSICVNRELLKATGIGFYKSDAFPGHPTVSKHTHTRLTALFRDHPGEPVPERWNQSWFYWSKRQWVQWHQLGHMQVCISLQTDNHASTPPL